MLSVEEFTVGPYASAENLSLALPRNEYENYALIGRGDKGERAAVLLSGQFKSLFLDCSELDSNWAGLIVPNVRIEVDNASLFDPGHNGRPLGAIIRRETRLVLVAKMERAFRPVFLTLQDGLVTTGDWQAGFTKWQIVIGEEQSKRVLWAMEGPWTDET